MYNVLNVVLHIFIKTWLPIKKLYNQFKTVFIAECSFKSLLSHFAFQQSINWHFKTGKIVSSKSDPQISFSFKISS